MRRTRNNPSKKASAVLMADMHIRSNKPLCRTDDFLFAQTKKLHFIFSVCQKNNCPLLIAGDIGDRSQWSNALLYEFISTSCNYDIEIIGIPGQHDLPKHNLEDLDKSGCGVLNSCGIIRMIKKPLCHKKGFTVYPFPYDKKITPPENTDRINVALSHQMVIENKPLWKDQIAPKGHEILKKNPGYNLIVTGDNHSPFTSDYNGRALVNSGSMMRMTAAQIDFKPRIYKWFADTNKVVPVYLPIETDVITNVHIELKKAKDEKMEVYASRMASGIEVALSFEKNMEAYLSNKKINKNVKHKVLNAISGEI